MLHNYYFAVYIGLAIGWSDMLDSPEGIPSKINVSWKVNLKPLRTHTRTDFVTVLWVVFRSSADATACSVKRM